MSIPGYIPWRQPGRNVLFRKRHVGPRCSAGVRVIDIEAELARMRD